MRLIFCSLLITLLSACSNTEFRQLQSSDQLGQLQGFAWDTPALTEADSNASKFDRSFRQAIGQQLQSKGYQPNAQAPQLLLEYNISIIQEETRGLDAAAEGVLWSRDTYNGGIEFDGWNHSQGAYELHEKGVLLLTVRAADSRDVLWQGGVARIMEQDPDFSDLQRHAKRAAARLAKALPQHK